MKYFRLTSTSRTGINAFLGMTIAILSLLFMAHTATAYEADDIALGDSAIGRAAWADALVHYSRVLESSRQDKSGEGFSQALINGGNACVYLSRYVEALDYYAHAVRQAERQSDRHTVAIGLSNIGLIYALFSDYERAIWYFEKAYHAAHETKDKDLEAISAVNLVKAYCYLGDTANALRCFRIQMTTPLASKELHQYFVLFNQGMIAITQKDYKTAIRYLSNADETASAHGLSTVLNVEAIGEKGRVYELSGNNDSAFANYSRVIDMGSNEERQLQALRAMARISRERGDSLASSKYDAISLALSDSLFNRQLFNSAKGRLFNYETGRTEKIISGLRERVALLICAVAAIVSILFIIGYYSLRLRRTKRIVVLKNQDLIRQNEKLRQMRSICEEISDNHEAKQGERNAKEQEVSTDAARENDSSRLETKLGEERIRDFARKIESVLGDPEMLFRPDFDLGVLAKAIGTNVRYASMVVNGVYSMSFKRLINEYRIQEACRRLTDKENYGHLTIAAIAQSVGYNSAANFISAFKTINGMTPSQYQRLSEEND